MGVNPTTLIPDGVATAGKRSVSWENGKPVVSFPIPGVPGAMARYTQRQSHGRRVVVKQGTTTEFLYSDYQDWNNPLNKIEAMYAGKMTGRKNGAVVRDLGMARAVRLQARVLGQGAISRPVDEQGRSDHDVPADGNSPARPAAAHLPVGE
jgi:hypothetical protein